LRIVEKILFSSLKQFYKFLMSYQEILVIALATLIGVAYLFKVRSYDIYEKEPISVLLVVAFVGGFVSIGTTVLLYFFVNVNLTFFDAIFKIGMIEELSKLIALIVVYRFIRKEFNEIVDGIVYITAISLGFAIIENITYAFRSDNPFVILSLRSVVSVLGHISFTGYMGIAFYIHKRVHKNYIGLWVTFLLASFAHGFYNGFLFTKELNLFFVFIFISLVMFQFWFLRTALGFSTFRLDLVAVNFEEIDKSSQFYCSLCERSINEKEVHFGKIKGGRCSSCKSIIFSHKNTIHLLHYFRPVLKARNFLKHLPWKKKRIITLDAENCVFYDTKTRFLSAPVLELSLWLKTNNIKDKSKVLARPVIGFILKNVGLKYIR